MNEDNEYEIKDLRISDDNNLLSRLGQTLEYKLISVNESIEKDNTKDIN